jgi:hypothetical protein
MGNPVICYWIEFDRHPKPYEIKDCPGEHKKCECYSLNTVRSRDEEMRSLDVTLSTHQRHSAVEVSLEREERQDRTDVHYLCSA